MGLSELNSLDSALDRFLQQEISISTNARQDASRSQNNLRGILRGKADKDTGFPEILVSQDRDFLGGSFARHTKIWPLDDIDLFLPMDGAGLIYVNNGYVLPFGVASDGGARRIGTSRWMTNSYVDSSKILDGFLASLWDSYPSSKIGVDQHCVNLQTTLAATSESDGIGFDVVPCFLMQPNDGSENFYTVPDGIGGWMRSNPKKDNEVCAQLQEFHKGTYRHAVRLLKYWNKNEFGDRFQSYYIELAASKRFNEYMSAGSAVVHVAQAFAIAFSALTKAHAAGAAKSLVTGAPDVPAPLLDASQTGFLIADATRADTAFNAAWTGNDLTTALTTLNYIFSTSFFQ